MTPLECDWGLIYHLSQLAWPALEVISGVSLQLSVDHLSGGRPMPAPTWFCTRRRCISCSPRRLALWEGLPALKSSLPPASLYPVCLGRLQMFTCLHLRTHHLWRTIKEVGLLSEDHLRLQSPLNLQFVWSLPCLAFPRNSTSPHAATTVRRSSSQ